MAACQIRRRGGGGQWDGRRRRREKQRHKWRYGEQRRGRPQVDVGIGRDGQRSRRRRRRKRRNEMQKMSMKTRRGKWHVTADFSTICNLSQTALLNHNNQTILFFLPVSQSPCHTMWICLSLSQREGTPHLSGGYQDGYVLLTTEAPLIFPYVHTDARF